MAKKIVGIFIMTLLIISSLPAIGMISEKEDPLEARINDNSLINKKIPYIIKNNNYRGIFIQLPTIQDSSHFVSDIDRDYICYEDFLDITTPICDIHWWCIPAFDDGSLLSDCDPTGMTFDITFYEKDGLYPGNIVCQYTDIIPDSITPTGILWESATGGILEIRYFEYNLDPCCELSEGWVSILKKESPNNCLFGWTSSKDGNKRFLQFWEEINNWVNNGFKDLSLVLTDGEPAIPDLNSDESLIFTDVSAGKTVNSSFNIANIGDPTSILHWKIKSYPDWGFNWTFKPSILTPEMSEVTVEVEVVAPDEENQEFEGEIKIVNIKDPNDFSIISVTMTTQKNKPYINNLFLNFLQQYQNMFQLLQNLLKL
jgi:hypothetical protein